MASTFTANKTLEEPANGDDVNTWNVPVNANWTAIDVALGGLATINAVSASGTVALTLAQYKPPTIVITGALTANVNYQLPSGVGGQWSVFNNTSGAFTVTISSATGGGTTVVLAQGFRTSILCDQTNVALASTTPAAAGGSNTQVQYNSSGALTGSANLTFDGTILRLTGPLRFQGSSSGYMAFQCPSVGGNVTFTLPATDGASGSVLSTNGSGALSWTAVGAGVTSFSASTTGFTPSSPTGGAIVLGGVLSVAHGGTGSSSAATGTGGVVLNVTPTLSSPVLNTPTINSPVITGLAASTTVAGILKTATAALVQAGSDATTAVTPQALNQSYNIITGIVISNGSNSTWAPGFTPVRMQVSLTCLTPQGNWQAGDQVILGSGSSPGGSSGSGGIQIARRGSNVAYVIGSNGIFLLNATTGSEFNITNADWTLNLEAWAY